MKEAPGAPKRRISRQAAFILFLLEEAEKEQLDASLGRLAPNTRKWRKTFAHWLHELRLRAEAAMPLYAEDEP